MSPPIPISVVMIARNAAQVIAPALESAREFDEVVVYENNSTDNTVDIAAAFANVKLVRGSFIGYGPTKNEAARHARHDWVFNLDCDERLTPALVAEIRALRLDEPQVVYEMRRENWVLGGRVRFGDWGRDSVVRLYHRQRAGFGDDAVHESVVVRGPVKWLQAGLQHLAVINADDDILPKINRYTGIQAALKGQRKAGLAIYLRARWSFWRSFLFRLGFLDGWRGLLTAWYVADNTFYKHMKAHIRADGDAGKS